MPGKKNKDAALAMQNAAKTLLANIRFSAIDRPIRTVTMTSTQPNEGKTTVAYNLAIAAATSGRRTIIVECDMRRRSAANMIGVHAPHGLCAVLSDRVRLEDAVTATNQPNLYFLDVEPGVPNPPDIIASKRFHKLVSNLAKAYDFVIFDTPPVGAFVDAAELAGQTDGTLFVVRENFTRRELAQNALEQLKKAGGNVLGCVMNYCEHTTNDYYSYYYKEKKVERIQGLDQVARDAHVNAGLVSEPEYDEGPEAAAHAPAPAPAPVPAKKPTRRGPSPDETGAFLAAARESAAKRHHAAGGYAAPEAEARAPTRRPSAAPRLPCPPSVPSSSVAATCPTRRTPTSAN